MKRQTSSYDLNQDGEVTVEEIEEAIKRSFRNVTHDITELKRIQEGGLTEIGRLQQNLGQYVHKGELNMHAQQFREAVERLERGIHEKESKLLRHMSVLEKRITKLSGEFMGGVDLHSRLDSVEESSAKMEKVADLSHLNKELHKEMARLAGDITAIKKAVGKNLHRRLKRAEQQLSGIAKAGDSKALAVARAEIETVAKEISLQQPAQLNKIESQLSDFREHLASVEKLSKEREKIEQDLRTMAGFVSNADQLLDLGRGAVGIKDDLHALQEKVDRIEPQLKEEIHDEVSRALAKHEEKIMDATAFFKVRMADRLQGAVTREELETVVGALEKRYEEMAASLVETKEILSQLHKKASVVDELRVQASSLEADFKALKLSKVDIADLGEHHISSHAFHKGISKIDNNLKALRDKLDTHESSIKKAAEVKDKLNSLIAKLDVQEKQLGEHASHISELKHLIIDKDLKERKGFY